MKGVRHQACLQEPYGLEVENGKKGQRYIYFTTRTEVEL